MSHLQYPVFSAFNNWFGKEIYDMMSLGGFYIGFSSQSNQAHEFYMLLFKILEGRDWVSAVLSSGWEIAYFCPGIRQG